MSEIVTDLDWWAATRYPNADEEWGPASGRHSYSEEAALTPIFHALTRRGWRSRQHEQAYSADPVDEFHRDPLTAPIPVQPPASTRRCRELPETGRHHRVR
ncbi:hypothetical protein FHX44_113470 [Pseudonocardia hierapolitana]|uniref:Uncharacterized protein n=1 Tax=Pseudonocardia hierapolitana TaxID=1128676 RepID=A0A561SRR4_9PSEU|nr:hypothetical protein [Pseudonocardia hierapolitana]TWF77558.1 hypothetical protein FHX44_113470 [Pseudonocardia hierapolitana]